MEQNKNENKNENKQKLSLTGLGLIVLGFIVIGFSQLCEGSSFMDFMRGLLDGLAIGVMLVGVYIAGRSLRR